MSLAQIKKFYELRRLRQTPSQSPAPTQTGDVFPNNNNNNESHNDKLHVNPNTATPPTWGGFQFGVLSQDNPSSLKISPPTTPTTPTSNSLEVMEWSNEYSLTRRHPEPQRRVSIQARLGVGIPDTHQDTPKARSIHQRLGTRQRLNFESSAWNETWPPSKTHPMVEDENFISVVPRSHRKRSRDASVDSPGERAKKERRSRRFASVPPMSVASIAQVSPIQAKVEEISEFNVDQLSTRAERFSNVPELKKRAWRFSEEVASELVVVKEAKIKNMRFDRFRDDVESEEEEEDGDN
ncbi:hypothetical protein TCAL_15264 [Tigriopus californicus]|uniref:Uncharacterized protein n=1 Tax=Tigriopus californicus TaxID=6832 RepID=A0A553NAS3_TIGCA|nr:hypothetical protein TCAL_15264 [Tigriopus californicus]